MGNGFPDPGSLKGAALYYGGGVKEGLPFARISRQTMGLPGSCSERQ